MQTFNLSKHIELPCTKLNKFYSNAFLKYYCYSGTLTNSGPPKKRHKGWSPESPSSTETWNLQLNPQAPNRIKNGKRYIRGNDNVYFIVQKIMRERGDILKTHTDSH